MRDAAAIIRDADAILIGAGAGMGVDSGLPDFRGKQGFWKAYPHFAARGLSFMDLANPRWFVDDPQQAWGFYGHRYHLYRDTAPHPGFDLLRQWVAAKPHGSFVFTSNVDGHFQKAGFAGQAMLECHGSINHLQCVEQCSERIWPAAIDVVVDQQSLRAIGELPRCPECGGLARPNILMFGDSGWLPARSNRQAHNYTQWLASIGREGASLAVIELGAGLAVPTVRYECEALPRQWGNARLIRVNPRDCQVPRGGIALAAGALQALQAIDGVLV